MQRSLYEAFNTRDMETVFAGRQADVTILGIETDLDGRKFMDVHQIAGDMPRALLLEQRAQHHFTFDSDLVGLFEIMGSESVEIPCDKGNLCLTFRKKTMYSWRLWAGFINDDSGFGC